MSQRFVEANPLIGPVFPLLGGFAVVKAKDKVVDADTARQLHAEATSTHILAAWIVMEHEPDYPGKFVGRFVTVEGTPYVLVADTLRRLRDALPPGLDYADRTPADPKGVVEFWFAPEGA